MGELLFFPVPLSSKEEEKIEAICNELMNDPNPTPVYSPYKFKVVYFDDCGQRDSNTFRDLDEAKDFYDDMCDVAIMCDLRMPVFVELPTD
jgi:hypothetical protein